MANGINVKNTCLGENVVSGRERNCCDDEKFLTINYCEIINYILAFRASRGKQDNSETPLVPISHNIMLL